MSTKYGGRADTRYVEDDIALTDHALHRYRQRTPQDCGLDPLHAWRRGEWVKHPIVVKSDDNDRPPVSARVYREPEWGVVFLVDRDVSQYGAPKVVVTVNNVRGFGHAPTRGYLNAYGPHGGGSA